MHALKNVLYGSFFSIYLYFVYIMETYKTIKINFISSLEELYSKREAEVFFNLSLFHLKEWNKVDFSLNGSTFLPESEIKFFESVLSSLHNYQPIQHILGTTFFYGLDIVVNNNVLIPRPETEELVNHIISDFSDDSTASVLDIGTGSGCILLALKSKLSNLSCLGIDLSEKAIEMAKNNAQILQIPVEFKVQDVFDKSFSKKGYDILVSNPPYIPLNEKSLMAKNVVDYEPHNALFVSDSDPLRFYYRIAELGKSILNKNGKIYFEIHEKFGEQVVNLLSDLGYTDICLISDLQGKDRFVKALK